jgi:hypothetical protein
MDHDQLTVPRDRFSPLEVLRGWRRDASHMLGEPGPGRKCVCEWLAIIYRVDTAMAIRGRAALFRAAIDAAQLTRKRLANDPALRAFFHPDNLVDAGDWEAAATAFLRSRRLARSAKTAVTAARKLLASRGRAKDFIATSIDALGQFTELLDEYGAVLIPE